jgi:hypothetical protein
MLFKSPYIGSVNNTNLKAATRSAVPNASNKNLLVSVTESEVGWTRN